MAAQFSYFTTSDDLREIVKQVDANTQFQYIEYKNFPESEYPNARMYDSLLEYPHLGYARSAQCRGDMFLVLNPFPCFLISVLPAYPINYTRHETAKVDSSIARNGTLF